MRKLMAMKALLLALVIVSLGTPQSAAESAQPASAGIHVTVNIFSGRPAPEFVISNPDVIREVLTMIAALPKHPASGSSHPLTAGLGYSGFTLKNSSSISSGIGFVQSIGPSIRLRDARFPEGDLRLDQDYTIEKRLLEIMEESGGLNPDLVRLIKDQAAASRERNAAR